MKNTFIILEIITLFSCFHQPKQPALTEASSFGGLVDGKQVELFTLKNIMA